MQPGHRRRPPGLRRDRLVDQPRPPQALPRAAAGGARGRAGGAPRGAHRRGRRAPHGHLQRAARRPARGRPALAGEDDRRVPVGARPARRRSLFGMNSQRAGLEGADGRRRRDRAVELPVRGHDQQARPGPRHRQHHRAQAGARHARGTPPGSAASSPRRPTSRRAWSTSSRRPTTSSARSSRCRPLVDMISFTGSTVTGKRIMEKGAATLKRVFLELGGKSAMIVLDDADFAAGGARRHRWCACTPARAAPCRPGCCCPGRATTRASS